MNHIYRVIFNHSLNCYQAAPEISKGAHKSSGSAGSVVGSLPRLSRLSLLVSLAAAGSAYAAPTGGEVSAGQATIAQQGNITDIQQSSQNAAINWQSFGTAPQETVNFHQPNADAVTLNRVLGNERSVLEGAMNANGNVFIQNPNGVLIGKDAQINVGGLVATTARISDEDFMAGNYRFNGAPGSSVKNLGNITVPPGGTVALIAPVVANSGTIRAPQGKVLLASAEAFRITLPGDSFAYTLDRGTLQGLVDNGGAILSEGGHVVLTALGTDTVKKSLIRHSGNIEANTVRQKNGKVELLGDLDNSELHFSGSIKAEAPQQGDGGFVETSAARLKIADSAQVSTEAKNGKTGEWLIDPKDFTVAKTGGDMTGETLSRGLAKSNATMHSTSGQKEGKGNINIFDEVNWDKTKLTLDAQNDINIFSNMNGSGTAKLELKYGQKSSDGGDAEVKFRRNAKINLPAGENLSVQKGSSGAKQEFTVIHDMPQWDLFPDKNIAIGRDIDASYTANRTDFKGFHFPGGDGSGSLWGLGHEIKGVTIKGKYQEIVGFIPYLDKAEVRDLKITNFHITGDNDSTIAAGGVTGHTGSSVKITNVHTTGTIKNAYQAGGIIGVIEKGTKIYDSSAKVDIDSSVDGSNSGGIVGSVFGFNDTSYIINSSASGRIYIDKNNNTPSNGAGGLVGAGNNLKIRQSYSDVNLLASEAVGGLVGIGSKIEIQDSYATGKVISKIIGTGSTYAGGLVGRVFNSPDTAVIKNSFAVGEVRAETKPQWTVNYAGGLIGSSSGGKQNVKITNSYFNTETTGQSKAIGENNYQGGAKTTAEMKQKSTYQGWDFNNVWKAPTASSYPDLLQKEITSAPQPNPQPNPITPTPSKPNPSQNVQTPPAKNDTAANKQPPKKPDVEQSAKPKPDIKPQVNDAAKVEKRPQVNKLDDKTATEMNAEIFGLHNSANIAKKEESETRKQIVLDKYKENQEIKQKEREVRAMISPKLRSELDSRGELDNFVRGIAVFSYQNKKSALEIIDIISSLYEINEEAEDRAEDLAENITTDVKLQGGWGTITVKEYFESIFEARMKHNLIDRLLDFYPKLREQANQVATQYGENRERYNKFNMNRINKEMSAKKISTINKEGFFEQTDSTIQWVGRTFLDATANNAFSLIDAFKTTYHGAKTYVMYEISSAKSALNDAKKSIAKVINIAEKEKHLEMLKNEAYLLDFTKTMQELLMENIPEASSNITDLVARDPEASVKLTHSVRKILNNINAVTELVDGNKYVDFANSIGDLTEKGDNIIQRIETLKSIDDFSNELLSNGEKDQFKNIYIRNIIHDGIDALDAVNKAIFAFVEKEKAKQISEAFSNAKDTLSSLSKMAENVGDRDLAMKMRNIDRFVKNEKPYLSNIVNFQRKELQEMFIAIGESEKSKGTSR